MANYTNNENELVLLNDKTVVSSLTSSISTTFGVPTIPSQKLFKQTYDDLSGADKSISDFIEDVISADLYQLSGQHESFKAAVEISCDAISDLIGSISTDLSNAITADVKNLSDLQLSASQISSEVNRLCAEISNDLTAKYEWLSGEANRLCTELSDNVESKFVYKAGDTIDGKLAIENSLSVKSNAKIDGNLVVGTGAQATGENTIALGSNANGNSFSHAFIWNSSKDSSYSAHDNNTFNINPIDGLNGFYVGDKSLSNTLSEYQLKSAMPTDLSDFQDKSNKYALSADVPTKVSQLENDQGYLISSDFYAEYVKETKKIIFTAGSKTWDIDATAFIKDGMLSSARYDGTGDTEHGNPPYIVLTFNADAGKEPIWIECASFVDTYEASGNGIKLDDHTFSLDFSFVGTKANDDYLSGITEDISNDIYGKIQPNVNNIQEYVDKLSVIGSYDHGNRGIIQTLSDDILSAVNSNIRTVKQFNKHIKIADISKTYDSLCAFFTDHNIYDNDLGVKNGTIVDVKFDNNLSGQIVIDSLSICNDEYLLIWDDGKIPYVRLENLKADNVKVLKTGVSQHEFALEIQDRIAVDNYISVQVDISAAALCTEISSLSDEVSAISSNLCTEISRLSDEVSAISNDLCLAISSKVCIRDLNDDGTKKDIEYPDTLSVVKISKDDFDKQVGSGTLTMSSNVLYVVSSDYMDAYGQVLCNLVMTDDNIPSDAANKHYVDEKDEVLKDSIDTVSADLTRKYDNLCIAISSAVDISAAALCTELSNCEISVDGLSDYIGKIELSVDGLSDTIDALCTEISNDLTAKYDWLSNNVVTVSNDNKQYHQLSVIKIGKDEYDKLVADDETQLYNNTLYVVDSDYIDAYGQVLCNLVMTDDSVPSDAANKHYVDEKDNKLATDINAVSSSVEVIKSKFNADTIATDPVLAKLLEDKNDSDISTVISAVMYIFNTLTQV